MTATRSKQSNSQSPEHPNLPQPPTPDTANAFPPDPDPVCRQPPTTHSSTARTTCPLSLIALAHRTPRTPREVPEPGEEVLPSDL
jgi:hypothetical protein